MNKQYGSKPSPAWLGLIFSVSLQIGAFIWLVASMNERDASMSRTLNRVSVTVDRLSETVSSFDSRVLILEYIHEMGLYRE